MAIFFFIVTMYVAIGFRRLDVIVEFCRPLDGISESITP